LNNQKDPSTTQRSSQPSPDGEQEQRQPARARQQFVEPTISVPVDVLEATAFFQGPTATTAIVP